MRWWRGESLIRRVPAIFAVFVLMIAASSLSATTVSIDTSSAKAVLEALQNPALTQEASLKIAEMHGNQGIIRKSNGFKIPATTQNFADALYAAAHGIQVMDPAEQSYGRMVSLDLLEERR